MSGKDLEVIIVGAGLAGLSCALHLKKKNIPFLIVDAADRPGGRVRTDIVDGFKLDRGFQVFLTAYPEARRVLDYQQLNLKSFRPGALVRLQGKFHRVTDPCRDAIHVFDTLATPIGSVSDKVNIAKMRFGLSNADVSISPDNFISTLEYLKDYGFSSSIIESFFKPFFGGVFLERELETSARNFAFLFRMFSSGDTVLPENGMEAIPKQLAEKVGMENIRLGAKVVALEDNAVVLASGEKLKAANIVLATAAPGLKQLVPEAAAPEKSHAVTCIYYSADVPPLDEPILVLNGHPTGVINNLCVPSIVAPAYAPVGKSLISVTVLGDPSVNDQTLEQQARRQLVEWYDSSVETWKHLRTYRIEHALPSQTPADASAQNSASMEIKRGLYTCGDFMSIGSINGALESGRMLSELLVSRLSSSVKGGA